MAAPSFDRRRVNGPEESFPPIFDNEAVLLPAIATGRRSDGRGKKDLRPICDLTLHTQEKTSLTV